MTREAGETLRWLIYHAEGLPFLKARTARRQCSPGKSGQLPWQQALLAGSKQVCSLRLRLHCNAAACHHDACTASHAPAVA